MADDILANRVLACREDFLLGNGSDVQQRGGGEVSVTKVNSVWYATSNEQIASSPINLGVIALVHDEQASTELEPYRRPAFGMYKHTESLIFPPPYPPGSEPFMPEVIHSQHSGYWVIMENWGGVVEAQIKFVVCQMLDQIFQEDTPSAGDVNIDPDAACSSEPPIES